MKYCQSILNEISFNLEDVSPCCCLSTHGAPKYIEQKDVTSNLNIDIKQKREEMLNKINTNTSGYSCYNCVFLKDDENFQIENAKEEKINSIYLRHWTKCKCNCVHCDNIESKTYGQEAQYNPYTIIETAYNNGLIDSENLTIRVQGGDLGVLPNFNDYMELFQKNGFKAIHFSTNNIIYQPKIEEVLKEKKGSLNVSIDCSTQETYKKIKRVDEFDNCINNLKKYIKNAGSSDAITIHYILIKGYNDNKKEIKSFFDLMNELGIKCVGVRIDHKFLDSYFKKQCNIKDIQKHIQLTTYFNNLAQKYNFLLDNDVCIEQNFVINKSQSTNKNIIKRIFDSIFH